MNLDISVKYEILSEKKLKEETDSFCHVMVLSAETKI